MKIRQFYLALLSVFLFVAVVIAQFFLCGIYFRFIRPSDFLWVDLSCALAAPLLCYAFFRGLLRTALREKVPRWLVAGAFLFFSFLAASFLRFSLQLANGGLDFTPPEEHLVVVVDKQISAFGGSVVEGINPMAHLVYFRDRGAGSGKSVLLAPQDFYYSVDVGSVFQVTLRRGLFHLPWVEDFRLLDRGDLPQT